MALKISLARSAKIASVAKRQHLANESGWRRKMASAKASGQYGESENQYQTAMAMKNQRK